MRENRRDAVSNIEIPFGSECLAEAIGHIQEFANCLSKHAGECPFATPFGYTHFCKHPRRKEIIELTKAQSA